MESKTVSIYGLQIIGKRRSDINMNFREPAISDFAWPQIPTITLGYGLSEGWELSLVGPSL